MALRKIKRFGKPSNKRLKMKKIKLTQGKYAIVDDEDYFTLNKFKWYANKRGDDISPSYGVARMKRVNNKQNRIYMHEFLCGKKSYGIIRKKINVGHINGNTLDNRRSNLILISDSLKVHMSRARLERYNYSSKYKGVSYAKERRKWRAYIKKDGKTYFAGSFLREKDAGISYNEKAREIYGELAYQNKIE